MFYPSCHYGLGRRQPPLRGLRAYKGASPASYRTHDQYRHRTLTNLTYLDQERKVPQDTTAGLLYLGLFLLVRTEEQRMQDLSLY